MTSTRRIGAPDAKNRGVLMDAAEQLLLEEGWAAVSSRRIAERAGLKHQLVHYYFCSMDEIFLGIVARRAEQELEKQKRATQSEKPLRALWEFSINPTTVRMTMEFMGLSNHRPAIRAAVAEYTEKFRTNQINALTTILSDSGLGANGFPPAAIAMLMTSVSWVVVLDQELGVSGGHAETLAFVERAIEELEGPPKSR